MRAPDLCRGSIDLWRCEGVRVEIVPAPEVPDDIARRTEARWAELVGANERLHDGPALSVDAFDPETGRIVAHRDGYARLAVQPEVDTGVVMLAVGGVLTASDASGDEHVLMIRRHEQTRLYPGLWEAGPAGGIDPVGGVDSLGFDDLIGELARELEEEAGLREPLVRPRVAILYRDNLARTIDVVIRASLGLSVERLREVAGETHWDASEVRWVPVRELTGFVRAHETLDATIAQLEVLGLL